MHQILVNGKWVDSNSSNSFHAVDPSTAQPIAEQYPVSTWDDCEAVLNAAADAFDQLRKMPGSKIAEFLEAYADAIEERAEEICALAFQETGLPVSPRLLDVELPRTTNQIRQAAAAASDSSWRRPTIDTSTGIRSVHSAIGPVAVFGPNNFPLAFGSISGGDFAAALAAGNPVIAKANSSHPGTTRLFAEQAQIAADRCSMPAGSVQLLYRMSHEDGERFVADSRLAAVGYTGSRGAGLKLKAAADTVGTPIYLELSSINPVVVLPGAMEERGEDIAAELSGSCLLGTGQFCTSPGVAMVIKSDSAERFIDSVTEKMQSAQPGILLSSSVQSSLDNAVQTLVSTGAEVRCGGQIASDPGIRFANTVLTTTATQFLSNPDAFQTEAFGNATLFVVADDSEQLRSVIQSMEGNLTGCIYSHTGSDDDAAYDLIEPELRQRVGRLLNDKMPTGVAVSPAMNHGGPFPATGHPGFTAVGMPDSITRFSMLQCYDNVRSHRLPTILHDDNPEGALRRVDGQWTRESVAATV